MAQRFTRTQKLIMHSLLSDSRWEKLSLYALCNDLGIDYANGWKAAHRLAEVGLISITKPRGRDLVLSMGAVNHPWGSRIPNPNRGSGSQNIQDTGHRTQEFTDMLDYPRPDLSDEEEVKYSRTAARLNAIQDQRLRLIYFAAVVAENVRLLKEVNEHRAARGLKPLPVYEPDKTR